MTTSGSDVYDKHRLADGRAVWIQRVKIPRVRRAMWSVVVTGLGLTDPPDITNVDSYKDGLVALSEILKADVLESEVA